MITIPIHRKLSPDHSATPGENPAVCSICGKPVTDYGKGPAHKRGRVSGSPTRIEIPNDPEASLKNRIRSIVTTQARVNDISSMLEFLSHLGHPSTSLDVTKALWSLQKAGYIAFDERKMGSSSVLVNIRPARGFATKTPRNGESKGRHPVGKDMTDPRQHKDTAVAVSGDKPKTAPQPQVVPTVTYVTTKPEVEVPRYNGATPLAQNTKPVTDEETRDDHPQDIHKSSDTHTQYPGVTVDNYPAMFHLLDLKANNAAFEKAAEALLDVDEPTANMLLGKATTFNTLEKEVIRFLEGANAV